MVELGGMLAAAILKVVADQVGSAIGGQIKLHKNFDKELKKMKMALESVDALLKVADRRSITDEPTLLWLKRLKDAFYVISDMIDEFEADTEAISRPSARKYSFKKYLAIMIPCLTIGPKITMANKMEKMREDLEVITDQHNKFKLTEGPTSANEPNVIDIRETTSTMETQIVGRSEDKYEILSSLSESMTEEITILPICGIGGLGKTTLAKMVYNSSQLKQYSKVWVYVSHTFDLKKIGNSIISQLSTKKKESVYTTMQMIHNSLEELLADKKILIVLDDLWECEVFHLKSLMDMLKIGKGSNVIVIVTTRDEDIANKIYTIQPYKLAPLTDDMCWSIIKQKSAFESRGDKEQLEKIGKAIAMKCAGVALAAKSLGHMLQSMKFGEWESVRDNNIWTVSSLKDTSSTQVLASLKLSYSVMPSYLKLCFAYCAIFPKGENILKDDLIHQWVSLGFSTWQLGERYINQLLGLSFLEHSKSPSTIELYHVDIIVLTMHDLVHDLARSVMDDDILVAGEGNNAEGSFYHYALLDDCSKPLGSEASKIRALRFMYCDKIELHDATISSAKSLRVLDFSKCYIRQLPDSIGVLKQLRYLNAPDVQHATIPDSITKLSKLIYFSIHGSPTIMVLPESIGDMKCLMYLDLSGCSGIKKIPESFGILKELVHLDLSNCSSVGGISVFLGSLTQLQYLNLSHCPNIGEFPDALGGLSKLKYLNLSFSSYLKSCKETEVLGALTKLEYLNLSSQCYDLQNLPETFGNFFQLKYLNLSGCRYIQEFPRLFENLKSLVHLDLSNCYMTCGIPEALGGLISLQYLNLSLSTTKYIFGFPKEQLEVISNLTKLRYLNLSRFIEFIGYYDRDNVVPYFMDRVSTLPNVEHLDLSHNDYLNFLPESLGNLRKLHTLDVSGCIRLRKIPESISTIDSLKFLYMDDCLCLSEVPRLSGNSISLPHFVVHAADGESGSNLVLLHHTDPPKLEISRLENVKSAGEAGCIKLMEKQSLEDLELNWTREVKRFVDDKIVLEKLVPPSRLKNLKICGYSGVSFPAWVVGQLPNLERLILRDMSSLEEWNTSYSSGEEHEIKILGIHNCPMLRMKPLPARASRWVITNSDNVLSSWEECTVSSSSSSPVTTDLSVEHCKVPLHQWRLLQHLPGLLYLSIYNCADLTTSSPEIIQHLSSVKVLCLEDRDLEELPKWIGELRTLHEVQLSNWRALKGLHENMRQLTNLQYLELRYCHSVASLPHWLDELTSLKELCILECHVLRSLPGSIQQLTGLQKLTIGACPELKNVIQSEEGKMNLTHNQERACLLPSSLEELQIWNCQSIKSLPEGIEQLTNLRKLRIVECPDLKQWCELGENKMKLAHIQDKIFE